MSPYATYVNRLPFDENTVVQYALAHNILNSMDEIFQILKKEKLDKKDLKILNVSVLQYKDLSDFSYIKKQFFNYVPPIAIKSPLSHNIISNIEFGKTMNSHNTLIFPFLPHKKYYKDSLPFIYNAQLFKYFHMEKTPDLIILIFFLEESKPTVIQHSTSRPALIQTEIKNQNSYLGMVFSKFENHISYKLSCTNRELLNKKLILIEPLIEQLQNSLLHDLPLLPESSHALSLNLVQQKPIKMTEDIQYILKNLENRTNTLILGLGGNGKSTCLKYIMNNFKSVIGTSYLGHIASKLNGNTWNTFFHFPNL